MKYKVLVVEPIHEEGLRVLREKGYEVVVATDIARDELLEMIGKFEVLIVRGRTKVDKEVIDAGRRLRLICRAGVGLDNIDVDYARRKGVEVINTPEATSIAVAELVFGLLLCLYRRIYDAVRGMKEGVWLKRKLSGFELYGKTMGIIGLGRIGSEVAKRAKAFGMHVIGYRRHRLLETAKRLGIEPAKSIDYLLERSDIVSLHVPLTKETYHMIGERELRIMKPTAVLINTSRGAVVDTKALLRALREGWISGAALDVLEHEPPKESWEWELVRLPNVVVTPHIGAQTIEAQRRVSLELAHKIISLLEG
ncbi:MAG: 3-phosphoglycerate dehydrogenase [Thermoprotei archaeon]|nr:MAG: 3-phosphoglycerate dehydrogenase [Thermoprotei archaeon]RLF25481.1 MAG: 3-phosphoglycerate dehydrogenase [Thermoprotei archaeon]